MLFPFDAYFHSKIKETILARAGKNVQTSERVAWMRVSASNGLVLESLPATDSFGMRYGDGGKSGRVGTDFAGNSIYVENDRGYRPSPIIESLSVSFGDKGLSRGSKFTIKCFTLKQAELVAEYFLEPGYTVLVEFGWNLPKSISEKVSLSACNIAYFNKYEYVKKKQQDSDYTYDGFMGYITNAGFETTEGETYSINVELTSIGDVVAHLQQHRSGEKIEDKISIGGDSFSARKVDSTSTTNVGLALFMQMYNRLPAAKKNKFVKNLINETDSRGISFISQANFINMDEEIRKDLMGELQDTAVQTKPNDNSSPPQAVVPDSVAFISENSFIRLELAFEILNRLSYETKSVQTAGCPDLATFPLIIEYKDTICRSHPYIFSIDGSKLMIPNIITPDFGLVNALSAVEETLIGPILNEKTGAPIKTVNLSQTVSADTRFMFPQQEGLISSGYKFPIDTVPFDAERGQWGYLKDLYVNFEFFIEVMSKPNYVAKDIYYEILNGISSAANSIWLFEIVTLPSRQSTNLNQNQLEIVDLNLSGQLVSNSGITKFFQSGIDSAFLDSSFKFDIPAAMKNSIITERTENEKVDSSPEGNLPRDTGRLFASKPDAVIEIISVFSKSLRVDDEDPTESESNGGNNVKKPKSASELETEARKQNFELFMKFGTVIPTIKDRNGNRDVVKSTFSDFFKAVNNKLLKLLGGSSSSNTNEPTLESVIGVVAWSDPTLFRKLDLNSRKPSTPNNVLLQITFDFTIHGVSGIKTGDLFEIEDLPGKYKDNPFTVVEVSHTLNNSIWTTSISGQMKTKD